MGYLTELRVQWRPLLAAMLGLGCGFSMTSYVTSIMAPHLLRVMGMMTAAMATSSALGAALLSLSLKQTGGFGAFLVGSGTAVFIGSLMFILLPRDRPAHAN